MRCAVLLLLFASLASAQTTRYADPNGSDIGDCSDSLNPCQTIPYTIEQSAGGDTIELSAGEFVEHDPISIGHDLTIIGQDSSLTKIKLGENHTTGVTIQPKTFAIIEDLTIENGWTRLTNSGTTTLLRVLIQRRGPQNSFSAVTNESIGILTIIDSHITGSTSSFPNRGAALSNSGRTDIETTLIDHNINYHADAGALYNAPSGVLALVQSTITQNRSVGETGSGGYGGALYNEGTASISSSEISHNSAGRAVFDDNSKDGGGIYNSGYLTINNSTISANETIDGAGIGEEVGRGGGIFNDENGSLSLVGSTVSNNQSGGGLDNTMACLNGGDGAGIYNAGTMEMTDSIIEDNMTGDGARNCSENTVGGRGAGLYTTGSAQITRSMIRGNSTGNGGGLSGGNGGAGAGVFVSETGSFSAFESTISENETGSAVLGGYGGAIYSNGPLVLKNSTISSNVSLDANGGGTIAIGGPNSGLDLVASTVASNITSAHAGLIIWGTPSGSVRIINSIVALNSGNASSGDCAEFGPPGDIVQSFGNNIIGRQGFCPDAFPVGMPNANNDWVGTEASPMDPLLGPLADNGGPTLTQALLDGSIAIGNGTCTDLDGNPIETDQRGYLRSAPCDIGAFEFDGIVTEQEIVDIPDTHVLTPAYPNPFNPATHFTVTVSQPQDVQIDLFDILGRRVGSIHDGQLASGSRHVFEIDGSSLPSGSYFIVVTGERFHNRLQVTLIK